MSSVTIVEGHVLTALRARPAESVHCVVTSPPYWGLRDYGTEPQVWGGDAGCRHEWVSAMRDGMSGGTASAKVQIKGADNFQMVPDSQHAFCQLCGAWRGHLGLEPTPELYVAHLVAVFREVWRVLRKDGTCWLVIGDSYMASSKGQGGKTHSTLNAKRDANGDLADDRKSQPWMDSALRYDLNLCGLKAKDLVGIPWRVAFALQADGWWLRSDVVWSKLNPMPESVDGTRWEQHRVHVVGPDGKKQYVDCPGCEKCLPNGGLVLRWGSGRPTRSHEFVFPLARSDRYFYDAEAIKETLSDATMTRIGQPTLLAQTGGCKTIAYRENHPGRKQRDRTPQEIVVATANLNGRNRRSVWTIATQPFAGAHFATFPEKLVEPCILAGTSERGCCPKCGAPWVRVKHRTNEVDASAKGSRFDKGKTAVNGLGRVQEGERYLSQTIGWRPSCDCDAGEPVPCTVLDPFLGSGRTALVAARLGRDCVGIELKGGYCEMAERQVREGLGMLVEVRRA